MKQELAKHGLNGVREGGGDKISLVSDELSSMDGGEELSHGKSRTTKPGANEEE